MNPSYDAHFLTYTANTSIVAARQVITLLRRIVTVSSVLDVGCARGTWLQEWASQGVTDVCGVDGSYVDRGALSIDHDRFVALDLTSGFDLGRQFDVVQSLEVAEHLPADASARFIESLVRHSRGLVLFSAAPPGQGGEHHINERPYDYWRSLFRDHRYFAVDWLRPQLVGLKHVSFWYRYNTILYLSEGMLDHVPLGVRNQLLPDSEDIPDISPYWFRARKMIVRNLPKPAVMFMARTKAYIHSRRCPRPAQTDV